MSADPKASPPRPTQTPMEAAGDSAMKRFADLITSGKGELYRPESMAIADKKQRM